MENDSNKINIKNINTLISSNNNPLTLLFLFITFKNELTDDNLSVCLKLLLKNHSEIAFNYNIKQLFKKDLINYQKSWHVLNEFYKLMYKKMALILILKKWHSLYINKMFWNLFLSEQLDYLQRLKDRFLSIFDCSRGGAQYYIKLATLLKSNISNKHELLEDAKSRLILLLQLFGQPLFVSMGIPLITSIEFYELSTENLIKYFILIFEKFYELLNHTIHLFDTYNLVCIQLNNLLNPVIIKIDSIDIDSETEINDIQMFCK